MASDTDSSPLGLTSARSRRLLGASAGRRRLKDRAAAWIVTAGGVGIIASILGILLFIGAEVLPLASGATVEPGREIGLAGARVGALVADEHATHVATLASDGAVRFLRVADGGLVQEIRIAAFDGEEEQGSPRLPLIQAAGTHALSGASQSGQVVLIPVDWEIDFVGRKRVVKPAVRTPVVVQVDPSRQPLRAYAARIGRGGERTIAAQQADGSLVVVRVTSSENQFTGEVKESEDRYERKLSVPITHLVLDDEQANLYGADAGGSLYWWSLKGGLSEERVVAAGAPVSALSLLLGGRSLVVGQEDGALSVWFLVRGKNGERQLTRVRDFPPHSSAVELIAPSPRDKGFLAESAGGELGLYHSTAHRVLWTGRSPVDRAGALAYGAKADVAYLAGRDRLATMRIDNPHPEVSLTGLFAPVWYEGYDKPEYVWQSSGGTDDSEPKFSLTPLMFGTLKGTAYSLLIAIPLAVLGAMYTSQFMHARLKRVVKPAVEIMAALPSVVLGFLAGLWLAPRLEDAFPALLLMVPVLPVLTVIAGMTWQGIPLRWRGRFVAGSESIFFVFVLGVGAWLCLQLGGPFERLFFGGDFQAWLLHATGLRYDQRNAIVVGLAMGFAVIPIIFAIAEDAFSNVPRELVSGSLALGANRWQTVTRVVLPTASAGIFSAVMVGFGRAVGETMIVLMATGNTPILDWSPFNGFRTLSANIAVEIPEAPQFGTLYRVLFLAAMLLFVVTFVVNTAAEIVRQRLRHRYGRL